MAGSVNKVILIGNLGKDPEIRAMPDGRELVNLTLATSETWKDKASGERKEKTEWHRIVIFNEGLVGVCKNYLRKGSKVYIEGALQTRKWTDQQGAERYSTEIVLQNYNGILTMLDGAKREDSAPSGGNYDYAPSYGGGNAGSAPRSNSPMPMPELDDEIPF